MARLRDPRTGVVVNVSDGTASRLGWPSADAAVASAEASTTTDDTTCPDCGFVAKSAAGLAAHARKHDN